MALSSEEQAKIKYYHSLGMITDPRRVDAGKASTTQTLQNFLSSLSVVAISSKDFNLAEKMSIEGLTVKDSNPVDLHFVYNHLIDLYYKQRDTRPDSIERCVDFCDRDMTSIRQFLKAWRKKLKRPGVKESEVQIPRIPSFERLAIIYEKQGRFSEAINVCKKAIKLDLHDSTKNGFSGRLTRLEKKQNKL